MGINLGETQKQKRPKTRKADINLLNKKLPR